MKIAVGCDPNATDYKLALIPFVESLGHEVTDFGSDDPIYANVAIEVAEAVAAGKFDRGLLFCGTGIGISIAANKVPGIRAGVVHSVETAHWTKNHNDANVLCFGARVVDLDTAFAMVDEWLSTEFAGGKHERRINEIEDLDF